MNGTEGAWRVRKVEQGEGAQLRTLLNQHLLELSAYAEIDQAYPYFPLYFTEADRSAWFVEVDQAVAGFALVNRHAVSGLSTDRALAEFYILPHARRRGIGRAFANSLIGASGLQWELSVLKANVLALDFWRRVCRPYRHLHVIETEEQSIFRFRAVKRR
ncbi:hypothetical protein BJF93_14660 [Xaviernesmea oryzae]|uniref:N-acetyltransferase domain-containing protein n=1 Tax=Xaviernesmea oryzae TaxID=464029 RepID=A0A1Q9AXP4_9HYPH|nr:GNAT family N-acetyltransferase [Xaviernesmea oryzae]OLP60208.1 hypothetical protein BJF93_14660 [Xaviernesmea oryzae]SEK28393.1 Predicted acetyltransferase [Xaviernesmea oryzae]